MKERPAIAAPAQRGAPDVVTARATEHREDSAQVGDGATARAHLGNRAPGTIQQRLVGRIQRGDVEFVIEAAPARSVPSVSAIAPAPPERSPRVFRRQPLAGGGHHECVTTFGAAGQFMRATQTAVQAAALHPARRGAVFMNAVSSLTVGPPEVASALRPEGVTAADFAQLLAVFLSAHQQQASPAVVADRVDAEVPLFSDLAQYLRTGPGQLALVQILIAVLFPIIALLKPSPSPVVEVEHAPTVIVRVQVVPSEEEIAAIVEKEMREHRLLDDHTVPPDHAGGAPAGKAGSPPQH